MAVSKKVSSRTTTTYTTDKCSLVIVLVTVLIILIVVVSGICVKFFVTSSNSSIILIILICFLFVLGTVSLTVLELRRRRTKKVQTLTLRNGTTYSNIRPSAPVEEEGTSWQYSNRTTLPA